MKILLEGPDCSGKSTLARTLKYCFNYDYFHNTVEHDDSMFKIRNSNLANCLKVNNNIIVDRWNISEFIYGNIFRGKSRVTLSEVVSECRLFDEIIFCLPTDYNKYIKSFEKLSNSRDEYIKELKTISKIYYAYQDLYFYLKTKKDINIKRYDYFNCLYES